MSNPTLNDLLLEIEKRAKAVTPLPYKHFPIVVVGDSESHALMNEYLAFGLTARSDLPALLSVISNLRGKLKEYVEVASAVVTIEPDEELARIEAEVARILEMRK